MSDIRKLEEKDIEEVLRIGTNSYPSDGLSEEAIAGRKEFYQIVMNHLPDHDVYGLYRDNELLGQMILMDYTMNLHSVKTLVGGVRGVAVDLLHRKEKVAKDLISFTCSHFKEKGACMVALYPFRADFYKKMGFGYGATLRQYKIKPEYIPNYQSKAHLKFLGKADKAAITQCYNNFMEKNHGMFLKTDPEYYKLFLSDRRIVGYKDGEKVLGYINFSYEPESFFKTRMVVHEFVYETKEALRELCTFLHTQSDQFERIIFYTQDEYLHYLFNNPANGLYELFSPEFNVFCVSAVGVMYRIIDVKRFFEVLSSRNFGGQTCRLKITVNDDFYEPNHGGTIVHVTNGLAVVREDSDYDVEITLDVSEFSSLAIGAINFKTLLNYGLATITDEKYIDVVDKIFLSEQKPICTTFF